MISFYTLNNNELNCTELSDPETLQARKLAWEGIVESNVHIASTCRKLAKLLFEVGSWMRRSTPRIWFNEVRRYNVEGACDPRGCGESWFLDTEFDPCDSETADTR